MRRLTVQEARPKMQVTASKILIAPKAAKAAVAA